MLDLTLHLSLVLTGKSVGIPFASPFFGANSVLVQLAHHLLAFTVLQDHLHLLLLARQAPKILMEYHKAIQSEQGHLRDHRHSKTHMEYHKALQSA